MIIFLFFIFFALLFSAFPTFGGILLLLIASVEGLMDQSNKEWELLIALAFVAGYIFRLTIHPNESYKSQYCTIFIFLSIGMVASCLFSIQPIRAFYSSSECLLYLAAGYFIYLTIRHKLSEYSYLSILMIVLWLQVSFGYAQLLNIYQHEDELIRGSLLQPAYFSLLLAWLLPFSLSKFQLCQTKRQEILVILSSFAILVIVVAAKSRIGTGIIVFTYLACIGWGFFPPRQIRWLLGVIGIGFFTLVVFSLFSETPLLEQLQNWLSSPRLQNWIHNYFLSLFAFTQHPFTGVGFGQLEDYLLWRSETFFELTIYKGHFSTFSHYMAETGFIGTLPLLALPVMIWSQVRKNGYQACTLTKKAACITLVGWFAATLGYSIHEHLFSWCLLGILIGQIESNDRSAIKYPLGSNLQYKIERAEEPSFHT